jgi:hypothetical protein
MKRSLATDGHGISLHLVAARANGQADPPSDGCADHQLPVALAR